MATNWSVSSPRSVASSIAPAIVGGFDSDQWVLYPQYPTNKYKQVKWFGQNKSNTLNSIYSVVVTTATGK